MHRRHRWRRRSGYHLRFPDQRNRMASQRGRFPSIIHFSLFSQGCSVAKTGGKSTIRNVQRSLLIKRYLALVNLSPACSNGYLFVNRLRSPLFGRFAMAANKFTINKRPAKMFALKCTLMNSKMCYNEIERVQVVVSLNESSCRVLPRTRECRFGANVFTENLINSITY